MVHSPYEADNIFAKILRGDITPSIRYQDNTVIAFDDISPVAPIHVLVIPRGEYTDVGDFCLRSPASVRDHFFTSLQHIAEDVLQLREGGYRIIMNTGKNATQTVFHFHAHIVGGRPLGGLVPDNASQVT